jgi:hypothetical protein
LRIARDTLDVANECSPKLVHPCHEYGDAQTPGQRGCSGGRLWLGPGDHEIDLSAAATRASETSVPVGNGLSQRRSARPFRQGRLDLAPAAATPYEHGPLPPLRCLGSSAARYTPSFASLTPARRRCHTAL